MNGSGINYPYLFSEQHISYSIIETKGKIKFDIWKYAFKDSIACRIHETRADEVAIGGSLHVNCLYRPGRVGVVWAAQGQRVGDGLVWGPQNL